MYRIRSLVIWIAIISVASLLVSCSGKDHARSARDAGRYISEHNLKTLPRSDIPLVINERVVAWMEYFQGPGRRHFERYLARSGRYIPLMTQILKEQGMPRDLVYISLIESGFNDSARSHASAVGAWQFIRSTAGLYGLDVNGWEDERRDPYKATVAAAKFFRDLHDEFGDWYLAMAGYNAGPGRVRQAIAITGSKNFWDHAADRKALRAETRDYVPKFIAATIMAKDPQRFGFTNIDYEEPLEFESAKVDSQTDISAIAKCAGVSEDQIAMLNAHLVRGATPPGESGYMVKLPKGTSEKFRVAYAQLPEDERIKVMRHNVRKGDTLPKLARRYGVSSRQIAAANGLGRKAKLRAGDTLVIPVGAYAAKYASYDDDDGGSGSRAEGRGRYIKYKVKKGDTLGKIASRHKGVTVAKLRSWNKMGGKSMLRHGQTLKIYAKGAPSGSRSAGAASGGETYTVKKGETLGGIAARNGVSTKEIMAWNDIQDAKDIKYGQRLRVAPKETDAAPQPDQSNDSVASTKPPARQAKSTHKVLKGETLGHIAERYGMGTKELMALNGIKDPRRVKAGAALKVVMKNSGADDLTTAPVKRETATAETTTAVKLDEATVPSPEIVRQLESKPVATPVAASKAGNASGGMHELKPGETLGHVAEKYGVSTKQLMAWNNIKDPKRVRAGAKLNIKSGSPAKSEPAKAGEPIKLDPAKEAPGTPIKLSDASVAPVAPIRSSASTITYTVRSGETLWDIARRHSVTIAQLQEWNKLDDPSAVRAGTTLKVIKN
ncbi:MAG: LysM peptidoglycan-binding domain-containing protein [bacterium]